MANGLTAQILEGKIDNARDFLFELATRGNEGALWKQPRGYHFTQDPTYFEVDTAYYDRRIKETEEDISKYQAMTDEEVAAEIANEQARYAEYITNREERDEAALEKYTKVLEGIQAWTAPEELQHLKDVAIKQIQDSIEWDCKPLRPEDVEPITVAEWRQERIEIAQDHIRMYQGNKEEHIRKIKEANEWIDLFVTTLREWK